jgi:Domain of Unknown Function (DUF1206)
VSGVAAGSALRRATGHSGTAPWVRTAARFGGAARGLVFLVLAYLVARIASGALGGGRSTAKSASGTGVTQAIAEQSGGRVMLFVLGLGTICYSVFCLIYAATHQDPKSVAKKWGTRAASFWGFLVYGSFTIYALKTALSGHQQGGSARQQNTEQSQWSARVLRWPGGQVLMFAVGIALFAAALTLAVRAVRRKFRKRLDEHRMSRPVKRTTLTLGTIGLLGRGTLFAIVGWFVTEAAIDNDPSHGKGVDGSIRSLANDNGGAALLWVVAMALIAFGLYLLLEAAYRRF